MKIFHSADWHLGIVSWKADRPTDRFDEQVEMIELFTENVRRENPDLIVLAGDLLHSRKNPDLRSLHFLFEKIVDLSRISPVVVVVGNHDWRGIDLFNVVGLENVHVLDLEFLRKRNPLILETDSGKVGIIAIPYVSGALDIEYGRGKTLEAVKEIVLEMTRKVSSANVDYTFVAAHVMTRGSLPPQVEDQIPMIFDVSFFPSIADYVALGHVHSMSRVSNIPPSYYSGSVIQLDFSEEEDKGFLKIDVDSREVVFEKFPHKKVRTLDLTDIRNFKDALEMSIEEFDYIKILVKVDRIDDAMKMKEKCEKIVKVEVVEEKVEGDEVRHETFDFFDMFEEFFKLEYSTKLSEEEMERAIETFRNLYRDYIENENQA